MRFITLALALAPLAGCSCNGKNQQKPPADDALTSPGRVVLHRLNRVEYNNTVRDLLGTQLTPADDFPYDDTSHGYDNIAATLSVSPLHFELYERAADALAEDALRIPVVEATVTRLEGEGPDVVATTGGASGIGWNLWTNGTLSGVIDAPIAGTYEIRSRMWANQAGVDLAAAALGHDGLVDDTFDVVADDPNYAEIHGVEVDLAAGPHAIEVSFLNDYWDGGQGDRNLNIDWIELEGPLDLSAGDNPIREELLVCVPQGDTDRDCARQVLEAFVWRAWRRPVTAAELDSLLQVFDAVTTDQGTWDDGMRLTLKAVLLSPNFMYRAELSPDPASTTSGPLNDWEVAARLSYFLWSTMPDDALFAAAEAGELQTDEQIRAQVKRMLADPKADALVDNFAGQWLHIRGIDGKTPDPWAFPDFDDALRASMKEEMNRFFRSFIEQERDLHELLLATEGEIDGRLATHYGIGGVNNWTSVDLAAEDRGGLFGQAGVLMVNSFPARTSPVLRGKWVLSQLLCSEPPPPPPEVEGLVEDDIDAQTLRETLEQHRADPVCASCHDAMDPIGLGMEHFDGIGAWRDEDNGYPVDASGEMPDGETFYGVRELSGIIAADERYPSCIAEQLFTYALGRSPTNDDVPYLDQIDKDFADGGYSFEALAAAVATSGPFRKTTGETP